VVITYPGAVLGPHDPHLGDGLRRVRNILKGRYPIAPSGGYPIVDVRDVAAVHAAVLEPARGPAATWPAAPSCASPTWWRGSGR
jgi:nucleoside-diphosphate-sugar epimerase